MADPCLYMYLSSRMAFQERSSLVSVVLTINVSITTSWGEGEGGREGEGVGGGRGDGGGRGGERRGPVW